MHSPVSPTTAAHAQFMVHLASWSSSTALQHPHLGGRRPLAVPDACLALVRAPVQAVVVVALRKLVQASLVGVDGVTDVAEDVPAVPVSGGGGQMVWVSVGRCGCAPV